MALSEEAEIRLKTDPNIWLGSVRPDGRPHLTPVWFLYLDGRLYASIDPAGVKARNIQANPQVVLALEDGLHPVICEGVARVVEKPYPQPVMDGFYQKYEWEIEKDTQYNSLLEIAPRKWLAW